MRRLALAAAILLPVTWALASGRPGESEVHPHRGHHGPGMHAPDHHRPHHPPSPVMVADELGLDEAQRAELQSLHEQMRGAHEARRDAHEEGMRMLREELAKEKPDFEALEAMAVAEAEAMHTAHLDHLAGMRALAESLDPTQRKLLAAHLERRPPPPEHHGHKR